MKTEHLKIEFFVGTTLCRDGCVLPARFVESAHEAAERDLLAAFGGFTRSVAVGAWISTATDKAVRDTTVVYTVITNDSQVEAAKELKSRFQAYFNQESVLLVATPVFAQF